MSRSRESRKPKETRMTAAELEKASELLREAEQQNLTDGQNEIEAILKRRNITMFPQIILRGGKQIEQIVFVPAPPVSTKPLPIPESELEEVPTE